MKKLSQRTKTVSPPLADMLRGDCYFFLFLGIIALGYVGFVSAGSHVYQAVEMKKLDQAGPSWNLHVFAEGEVIGEIEVTRLGLNAIGSRRLAFASLTQAPSAIFPIQLLARRMGQCRPGRPPGHFFPAASRHSRGRRNPFQDARAHLRVPGGIHRSCRSHGHSSPGNINGPRPDLAHLLPDLLRRTRAKASGCSCARSCWSRAGATRE